MGLKGETCQKSDHRLCFKCSKCETTGNSDNSSLGTTKRGTLSHFIPCSLGHLYQNTQLTEAHILILSTPVSQLIANHYVSLLWNSLCFNRTGLVIMLYFSLRSHVDPNELMQMLNWICMQLAMHQRTPGPASTSSTVGDAAFHRHSYPNRHHRSSAHSTFIKRCYLMVRNSRVWQKCNASMAFSTKVIKY